MPLPQKRKRRTPRMGVHRVPRSVLLTQEGHKTNNDIPGHHNLDEGPIPPLRKPQQASYVVVSLLPRLLRLWFLRRPRDALLKG